MDIYIANLHSSIEEETLKAIFEVFGEVSSTVLVRDKETRLSKGYGFIKMENNIEAKRAIDDLNGKFLAEKFIVVKKAVPKESKAVKVKDGDFIRVKFEKPKSNLDEFMEDFEPAVEGEEKLSIEVKNKSKFTKTELEDGLVKVSFQND